MRKNFFPSKLIIVCKKWVILQKENTKIHTFLGHYQILSVVIKIKSVIILIKSVIIEIKSVIIFVVSLLAEIFRQIKKIKWPFIRIKRHFRKILRQNFLEKRADLVREIGECERKSRDYDRKKKKKWEEILVFLLILVIRTDFVW